MIFMLDSHLYDVFVIEYLMYRAQKVNFYGKKNFEGIGEFF
jgi:hypothetical protein